MKRTKRKVNQKIKLRFKQADTCFIFIFKCQHVRYFLHKDENSPAAVKNIDVENKTLTLNSDPLTSVLVNHLNWPSTGTNKDHRFGIVACVDMNLFIVFLISSAFVVLPCFHA